MGLGSSHQHHLPPLRQPAHHLVEQEPDPIIGRGGSTFTIPHEPARLRTPPLPRFVIPRGGGYFFVPSRATVELLVTGPST